MIKLFINFKPDNNIPYGGGNITTYYLQKYFENKFSEIQVTYELSKNINIFLIIDPFKDRRFKKYSLEDVINYRNKHNKNGKIIIRVNDCDITRPDINPENSREKAIVKNFNQINHFIFNSTFIKDHYKNLINFNNNYSIIHNGCDLSIFHPIEQSPIKEKNWRIVTHHWSPNMNKGYNVYYILWKMLKRLDKNMEFVFIGKNVPNMFKEVPIIGPYVNEKLNFELTKCNIYITDSINDSCPNHVIEAISCGIPILYRNHPGGGRELCQLFPDKIGESYNNFEELVIKIGLIKKNYEFYRNNILKHCRHFELYKQLGLYENIFFKYSIKLINKKIIIPKNTNLIQFNSTNKYQTFLKYDNKYTKINKYTNYIIYSKFINNTITLHSNLRKNKFTFNWNTNKLNNNKLNILFSTDKNYFIPMFASLNSVLKNSTERDNLHINFIIPIDDSNIFHNMLNYFFINTKHKFKCSIVLVDKNVLPDEVIKSKCYNGGNHLLNLGNFARLMIGEFFKYEKLIYLDSDSIIQCDIYNKLKNISTKNNIFCLKANIHNKNNQKNLVLYLHHLIDVNYCKKNNINPNNYAFYGAPFLTDCNIWESKYKEICELIKQHNRKSIYKLFTMSIQNIIFYKKMLDIKPILKTLPDFGSNRKNWDAEDIKRTHILDWSGIYKPWFQNGLYKHLWEPYDIFKKNFGIVTNKKNTIENFV